MITFKELNLANRYGLDIRIFDEDSTGDKFQKIGFGKFSNVKFDEKMTYARGGSNKEKLIGFCGDFTGEFTLSTEILDNDLVFLMAGGSGGTINWDSSSPIVFKPRLLEKSRYFVLSAKTVWQDDSGTVYEEFLVFHKVKPRVAYASKYSGDETAFVEVVFDVMQDDSGVVLTRGNPKSVAINQKLITTSGHVEDYAWILGDLGIVDGNALILKD